MLYESSGQIPFDLNEYKLWLISAVKFKDLGIINQDKQLLLDITNEFIDYCISHQNEYISIDTIKQLMIESKHYSNIKNKSNITLYFSIFNFSDDTEINSFHYKLFNITDDNDLTAAKNMFKQQCKNCDGTINKFNNTNTYICTINSNALNLEETIYHELSHFIQCIGNIHLSEKTLKISKNEFNDHLNNLKLIGITRADLIYYFSPKEFSVHVDELCKGLWKTYNKLNGKHIWKFIEKINNEILLNNKFNESELYNTYAKINNNDIAPLVMFIAAKKLDFKFDNIFTTVKNYLLKKEKENN